MRSYAAAILLGAFAYVGSASANVSAECAQRAQALGLSQAAKKSFLRKCASDRSGDLLQRCQLSADQVRLSGARKNESVRACMAERKRGRAD